MPRKKPVHYTAEQRIERRAEQAVRAIKAGRSIDMNELRVMRHVETLGEGDRKLWLTKRLGDLHESTLSIIAVAAQADAAREAMATAVDPDAEPEQEYDYGAVSAADLAQDDAGEVAP